MRLKNPFQTSFGVMQEKEFFVIEAIDHDGNRGYGESVAFRSPWYTEETVKTTEHMLEDFLIPILQKSEIDHPNDVFRLFRPIKRNNMAKASIEGAIWDLYAKQQNIPLAKAIGGEKTTIEVGISIGLQPTIKELLDKIEAALATGYKRIKLKIKPGQDIEMLKEVRQHFPATPIMVDANSAYTLEDVDHLRKLDAFQLMMIEQPLAHDDIVDHAFLQKKIETPICLDESINSLDDAKRAIQLGSCKVINIKIGRVGGIYEAKRIHDYCKEMGVDVWCGGMLEAGIGRAHNIALTTLSNFTLPGDTAGSSNYWYEDIIQPEVIVEQGLIQVPTKPGIGFDVKEESLNRFTSSSKTFTFN